MINDSLKVWHDEKGDHHREDGPSFTNVDKGYQHWTKHGKYHRLDGPARIWTKYGLKEEWYVDGTLIPTSELKEWMTECSINPNWKEWTDQEKVMFRLRFS